jgi:hypothetical protein
VQPLVVVQRVLRQALEPLGRVLPQAQPGQVLRSLA